MTCARAEPAGSGPDRTRWVGVPGLESTESRPLVGAWLLGGLWQRLGIDTLLRRLAGRTRRDPVVERGVFALVANRALVPSSKLAACGCRELGHVMRPAGIRV